MKRFIILYSLLVFLIAPPSFGRGAKGKLTNVFNLNTDNGLPDNHVYGTTVDKYGYLWLATDKGVVKYNGYDCRIFNLSNGLPTETVWQVYYDQQGRIWLGNFSSEMGYIYKDT